jgi:acid phosphatase type 7
MKPKKFGHNSEPIHRCMLMQYLKKSLFGFIALLLFSSSLSAFESGSTDPLALYLTWQQDPSTTMTIDWHSVDQKLPAVVEYRLKGTEDWQNMSASSHEFPFSQRTILRVELTGLQSDSKYEFRFGDDSIVYTFRTMPGELIRPIRIAIGGDTMHHQEWFERTNWQVLKYDPDFVVIGGDLAYADARPPEEQGIRGDPATGERADPRPGLEEGDNLWYHWFDAYKNTLITDSNRVIPMLVTIGNHEVRGGYYINHDDYEQTDDFREWMAPYFFSLFAMPDQPGYNVLDFGDYMSFILLDSGHANPAAGRQKQWLEEVLAERQGVPHVFPVYHIATYPSVRDFDAYRITTVREPWVPLFEEYGVRLVFENHDHAYKRTYPLRGGEIRSNGVVYIGDGSWGTVPRALGAGMEPEEFAQAYWYIKEAHSVMHFVLLTVDGPHQHLMVVDQEGNIIDEYPQTPRIPASEINEQRQKQLQHQD